jgi:hypothetical protein
MTVWGLVTCWTLLAGPVAPAPFVVLCVVGVALLVPGAIRVARRPRQGRGRFRAPRGRRARVLLVASLLGWAGAMGSLYQLRNGSPVAPVSGCAWPLASHGTVTRCVSLEDWTWLRGAEQRLLTGGGWSLGALLAAYAVDEGPEEI